MCRAGHAGLREPGMPFGVRRETAADCLRAMCDAESLRLCVGRLDWTRTNDPHHVKVVL
ncbi:protein of unknown function [Burkholderia multivorans]